MTPRLSWIAVVGALAFPALAFDPFGAATIEKRTDAVVPLDIPVQDQDGHRTTLRTLAGGKPILLAPVQHHCPNICGVTLAGLRDALAEQPFRAGRDVAVIAFGIDAREGSDAAASTLAGLDASPPSGFVATVADQARIAAVTDALGYRFAWDERIGQFAHLAATAVLTRDGHLARWIYGLAPEAADLRLAIAEVGQGQTGGWSEAILLLCYRYDPVTGRYTPAIMDTLRAGSLLCLAGFTVWFASRMRSERRRRQTAP